VKTQTDIQVPQVAKREAPKTASNKVQGQSFKTDRKEAILKFLSDHGEANIKELSGVIPGVGDKTIQREFERARQSRLAEQYVAEQETEDNE